MKCRVKSLIESFEKVLKKYNTKIAYNQLNYSYGLYDSLHTAQNTDGIK